MHKNSWVITLLLVILLTGCSNISKDKSVESESIIEKIFQTEDMDNGFRVEKSSFKLSSDLDIVNYEIEVDTDGDGIKDIEDMVKSAQEYINSDPKYDSSYHAGGYPPVGIGVCTDVIWNAIDGAGYNFKKLVDDDIKNHRKDYPNAKEPDPNIDFRRVKNLHVYLKKYAISLTTELTNPEDWMPGDIVIYKNDKHISICSDKRNDNGFPWIIHNAGQRNLEEDNIRWSEIIGHYRIGEGGLNY